MLRRHAAAQHLKSMARLPLPRMGRLMGTVVSAFELRSNFDHEGRLDRAERFFGDEAHVSDQRRVEAVVALVDSLRAADVLSLTDESIPAPELIDELLRLGAGWNSLTAGLEGAPPGALEISTARRLLLKLWALDLALRAAAYCRLTHAELPNATGPAWFQRRRAGTPLRKMLEQAMLTRDAFAASLGVERNQVDRWLDGEHLPSCANVRDFVSTVQRELDWPESRALGMQAQLRRHFGLCRLVEALQDWLTDDGELQKLLSVWLSLAQQFYESMKSWDGLSDEMLRLRDVVLGGAQSELAVAMVAQVAVPETDDWPAARTWVVRDWMSFVTQRAQPEFVTATPERRELESQVLELMSVGRRAEALAMLRSAILQKPDDSDLHLLLASWLGGIGERAAALDEVHLALGFAEGILMEERAQVELAQLLDKAGRKAEAVERLTTFVSRVADVPGAWYQLGILHVDLRDWSAAKAAMWKVLENQPGSPAALDLLALAEMRLGETKEARKHALQAYQLGHSNTWVLLTPEQDWVLIA